MNQHSHLNKYEISGLLTETQPPRLRRTIRSILEYLMKKGAVGPNGTYKEIYAYSHLRGDLEKSGLVERHSERRGQGGRPLHRITDIDAVSELLEKY